MVVKPADDRRKRTDVEQLRVEAFRLRRWEPRFRAFPEDVVVHGVFAGSGLPVAMEPVACRPKDYHLPLAVAVIER
jgi:hypothetical protein